MDVVTFLSKDVNDQAPCLVVGLGRVLDVHRVGMGALGLSLVC